VQEKTDLGSDDAFQKLAQMGPTVRDVHHRHPVRLAHVALDFIVSQSVRDALPQENTDGGSLEASSFVTHVDGTAAHRHQEQE
jgi:hypothetical protein